MEPSGSLSTCGWGVGIVLLGLAVDGQTVWRARFVLTAIAASNRALLVIKTVEILFKVVVDILSYFRHTLFFD